MTERAASASTKWRVSPSQKQRLLEAFSEEAYPSPQQKTALASQLGVTATQISKWFQHRRESLTRLGQFKAQYNRSRRTEHEVHVLQKAFDENSYPSAERLAQLESQLENVTSKQIKLWFKHRRKQSRLRSAAFAASVTSPAKNISTATTTANDANYCNNHSAGSRNCGDGGGSEEVVPPPPPPNDVRAFVSHELLPHGRGAMGATSNTAVYPPFSALELMALRGALCMSKSAPSPSSLHALATFLGRPVEHLRIFFDAELHGGYFWNYLSAIEPPPFVASTPLAPASIFPPVTPVTTPTAPTTPSLLGPVSSKTVPVTSPAVGTISPFGKSWPTPSKLGESSPNPYSIGIASPLLKLPEVSTPIPSGPSYQQVWYVPPALSTSRLPLAATAPLDKK